MKSFTVVALLAMVTSTFAGIARSVAEQKWISVESGITQAGDTNLSKRVGAEVITCYNIGTAIDRAPAISVIDDWCDNHAIGQFVAAGATIWSRYNYGDFTVLVSGTALTNCAGFTVDANCNRLLRLPLDGCNTDGENGKQGGYETDLCGQWRMDPGSNGSDF